MIKGLIVRLAIVLFAIAAAKSPQDQPSASAKVQRSGADMKNK